MEVSLHTIAAWQWAVLILGTAIIGLSKTAIPGIGILAVALFAAILPARESTGFILPLLIAADFFAVKAYFRHAVWHHLWRLFPWAIGGILIGYFTMGYLDNYLMGKLIGAILIVMVAVHVWRRYYLNSEDVPHDIWFAASMGLLAGFTTMVANAAGPIMVLYLLAMALPKLAFMGTAAIYTFLLNWFKVPFSYELGLLNLESLRVNAVLFPIIFLSAWGGKKMLPRINQQLFETLALIFTVLAAIKLLVF